MIIVYSVPDCKNCSYAKLMLEDHEVPFEERRVVAGERRAACDAAGATRFPLIYNGDEFIGGFRELAHFLEARILGKDPTTPKP